MSYERCPACDKKALRFRKRTNDYSCKECPFIGTSEEIDATFQAKTLKLARHMVLSVATRFAEDRGGRRTEEPRMVGPGCLAAILAVPATLGIKAASQQIEMVQTLGAAGGVVILLFGWLVVFVVGFVVLSMLARSRHEAEVARARSNWDREHPDAVHLRELRDLQPDSLGDPQVFALVAKIAGQARAEGYDIYEEDLDESLRVCSLALERSP